MRRECYLLENFVYLNWSAMLIGHFPETTIAVSIEPDLPPIPPTPTHTLLPTANPFAWNHNDTLKESKETLASAYQNIIDFLIWFGVVLLPILLPPALIVWLLWRLLRRKPKA
jgi:hypothetical protein